MLDIFASLNSRSEYFREKICRKCEKCCVCFREGTYFEPKWIRACDRIPKAVKLWYRAKELGIINMEQPLEIDLKGLRVIKGERV